MGDTRGSGSCIARGKVAEYVCQPSPGAVVMESVKAFHSGPLKSKDIAGKEIPAHLISTTLRHSAGWDPPLLPLFLG